MHTTFAQKHRIIDPNAQHQHQSHQVKECQRNAQITKCRERKHHRQQGRQQHPARLTQTIAQAEYAINQQEGQWQPLGTKLAVFTKTL